jgi:hypothetical protein
MTDVKLEDADRVAHQLARSVQWSPLLDQATALLRKIPELLQELEHEKSRLKRLASGEEP